MEKARRHNSLRTVGSNVSFPQPANSFREEQYPNDNWTGLVVCAAALFFPSGRGKMCTKRLRGLGGSVH